MDIVKGSKLLEPHFSSRKIPLHSIARGEATIDNLVNQNFIRPVTGSSDACDPAFLVAKRHNGSEAKLIVDYS